MTRSVSMDLNSDLGEGCGDDVILLGIVSSANIACGAHAGDIHSMRETVEAAVRNHVSIGAHVSYPDREHFGRRDLAMSQQSLTLSILEQLKTLGDVARTAGSCIRYLKAHGALYNRMADDVVVTDAVIAAIKSFDASLAVLTLPGSVAMQRARENGVRAVSEAFVDRAYTAGGRLMPRTAAGAIITDNAGVADRAVAIAVTGKMTSLDGTSLFVQAESLCIHGDTPGAGELARAVRAALEQAGITIRAFV